jgi:hypothetical protein
MNKFNYVIARRWDKEKNELSCYAFGATVFYGDLVDAKNTLEFIKGRADGDDKEQYQIYKINDEPIK